MKNAIALALALGLASSAATAGSFGGIAVGAGLGATPMVINGVALPAEGEHKARSSYSRDYSRVERRSTAEYRAPHAAARYTLQPLALSLN